MGRLRSNGLRLAVAIVSLWSFSGCGGGSKSTPIFPGRVNLTPASNTSLVLGGVIAFSSSVQTSSGTNINVPITYSSSDTSVLTLAPNGVACAGHWDVNFTTCTPGGTGVSQVTATALGASSVPTWVFVHPPIDNITVVGVLLDNVPIQEPCLSQTQTMTVEAHAFSQGSDITSSVGPFTFSANNPSVVTLAPIVNTAYNFATNQATVTALNPGITQIYATASGVSSSSFQQPQYLNSQGAMSPALDFFSTCPIQNVALAVGAASSQQQSGQTSFVVSKGTAENVDAVLTDVMGNTSLPNTNGSIVLSKIPLTWSSSQPGVLTTGTGCLQSCALSTPVPGSGTVTASCSPPTCNIGFPVVPASLSSPALIASCTQFFQAQAPAGFSCQQLIPVPVYASNFYIAPSGDVPLPGNGEISGVITGSTAAATVLSGSTGCAAFPPVTCSSALYSLSTGKASTGPENPSPFTPNSLLFDPAGDKAYMGSNFGAQLVNPAGFGTSTSAFTPLGTVTGRVLATSNNGNSAVFSDTIHTPNQVYVVNAASSSSVSASALNITGGLAAAYSPDGLKTFISGGATGSSLYIYSSLQALQGPIALAGSANSIAFSPNGAFAYIAESSAGTASASVTAFATCNNQLAATVALPSSPILMRVLPGSHLDGLDATGVPIPDGIHVLVLDSTGFDVLTSNISGNACPQTLTFQPAQRLELNQGTLQPVNFFASADASLLYVASAGSSSILVYNFGTGGVSGIELQGNATAVSADMSVDAGTIVVAGSDGMLHVITTGLGGNDQVPLAFPNLPNYLNPFCSYTPSQGACALNLVVARP